MSNLSEQTSGKLQVKNDGFIGILSRFFMRGNETGKDIEITQHGISINEKPIDVPIEPKKETTTRETIDLEACERVIELYKDMRDDVLYRTPSDKEDCNDWLNNREQDFVKLVGMGIKPSMENFLSHKNDTGDYLPPQGVKLHISFSNYKDYISSLEKIIPIFDKLNVCYKIVNPMAYGTFAFRGDSSTQTGKFITIYPQVNRPGYNGRSVMEAIEQMGFMSANCRQIPYETQFSGSVFLRYGGILGGDLISPSGSSYYDDRHEEPYWIRQSDINDFLYPREDGVSFYSNHFEDMDRNNQPDEFYRLNGIQRP